MGSTNLAVGVGCEWTAAFRGGSSRPAQTPPWRQPESPGETGIFGFSIMSTTVAIGPALQGALSSSSSLSAPSVIASVTVDFDNSVFLQMAVFSIAVIILKPLLFDPMLKLFALREERTDGVRAEARLMQEKAADILLRYEQELARVRADATVARDEFRKETALLESKILDDARAEAESVALLGQTRINEEMTALQLELDRRVTHLSTQLVGSVLGREQTS